MQRSRKDKRKQSWLDSWVVLPVLVLCAFALRIALSAGFQGLSAPPDPNLGLDHIQYAWIANDLNNGNGYRLPVDTNHAHDRPTAFRPPGTSFLIYAIYQATGQHDVRVTRPHPGFAAVRITFAALGALTLVPLFAIARRFMPRPRALLPCALLAVYPAHAYYSMHFYSEVPWTFALTLGVWLGLLWMERRSWGLAALQGMVLGLASLIRPIAFLAPFLQFGLVLLFHGERKTFLPRAAASIAACFLVVLPWGIRNHQVFGEWILFTTHGGTTLYGCHNEVVMADPKLKGRWISPEQTPRYAWIREAQGEVAQDARAFEAGVEYIQEHLHHLPELLLWKLIRTFDPNPRTPNRVFNWAVALPWLLLIPFVCRGIARAFRYGAGPWIQFATPLLMILAMTLIFYGDHRFRVSICPTLLLWATLPKREA